MKLSVRDLVMCGVFVSVSAILAKIIVPIGAVPITMQTFAVALAGIVLGSKKGFIAQCVYVVLGLVGVPVFSNFNAGPQVVFGVTGGYILSFPLMALIIGYFAEKFGRKSLFLMIGCILGIIVNYTLGTLMFSVMTKMGIIESIMACVAPFVVFDLAKCLMAIALGVNISKALKVSYRAYQK